MKCELCETPGGMPLWADERCRIVLIDDANYPGYCRVIWQAHVAEMSELPAADRRHLMDVVNAVELAVATCVRPDKINLASFGNMTPHLHWHVIPRWRDDIHFPQPIWAAPQRSPRARPPVDVVRLKGLIAAGAGEALQSRKSPAAPGRS